MKVEKLLKDNTIKYTVKKVKNVTIYNIDDEKMLIVIEEKSSTFSISRKIFNEIDEELLPYSFCLIDLSKNQMYYINIIEPNNFIRNSFDNTDKDTIFFGKQVLNNRIEEQELIKKIKNIGK